MVVIIENQRENKSRDQIENSPRGGEAGSPPCIIVRFRLKVAPGAPSMRVSPL